MATLSNEEIVVVSNEMEWDVAYINFMDSIRHSNVIGFDCEWVELSNWFRLYQKSELEEYARLKFSGANHQQEHEHDIRLKNTKRDKVSLLQMSAEDGYTLLVRLILFEKIPQTLKALLENPKIIKVGVSIYMDCSRLYKDWGVLVNSWMDIRFLLNDLPTSTLNIRNGLKAMGEHFCTETKIYSDKMRYSNWCGVRLDEDQIAYASQDSKIAIESFVQLIQEYLKVSDSGNNKTSKMQHPAVKCLDPTSPEFWRKAHRISGIHLNSKFNQDRYMSIKTGGSGAGKRKKSKDDVEESDSDLDLDVTCLNDNFKCDPDQMLKLRLEDPPDPPPNASFEDRKSLEETGSIVSTTSSSASTSGKKGTTTKKSNHHFYNNNNKSNTNNNQFAMLMSKNFLQQKSSGGGGTKSNDDPKKNLVVIDGKLYRLTKLD